MTYCVGVVYAGSVFLVADGAITFEGAPPPGGQTSSFNEPAIVDPDRAIHECALKVVEISSDCAVGMAGDVGRAIEAIGVLRMAYQVGAPIPDLLATINSSLSLREGSPFDLLVARHTEAGPELWRWRSVNALDPERVERFASIGGLASWHAPFTEFFVALITSGNMAVERLLPVLLAMLQYFGASDPLLQHGVGGVFSGLGIGSAGMKWMEDTNYVFHSGAPGGDGFVTVKARGGAVATFSTFTPGFRIFLTAISPASAPDWLSKWGEVIQHDLASATAKHWVIINPVGRSVLVLTAAGNVSNTSCIRVHVLGGGRYLLELNTVLRDYMLLRPRAGADAGTGIYMNFVNDETALTSLASWLHRRLSTGDSVRAEG